MVPLAPIADELLHKSIVHAVQNVCATMLKTPAGFVEKNTNPDAMVFSAQTHVFGCVGFVGKIDGVVYLCISDDFANFAASSILGMTEAEVAAEGEAVVKDVIGEITNMTAGCFKNVLSDQGYLCKLTLPTIVRGQNLSVATIKDCARHMYHFECNGHKLVADVQIKLG
ncbi:MAG: chemotaxis protein CheX [Nibricoccus sp.]